MNNKPIKQLFGELNKQTDGRNLYDITSDIESWIGNYDILNGLLTLQILHTSASLLINENYDSDVLVDLNSFFNRLVPDGDQLFIHTAEGKDDMPAHIRTALTQTCLSIPIKNEKLLLGQWQGIFIFEHRLHNFSRKVNIHYIGD
ncbi:secondary thiamine-phosphate synthase enzyme YjbQ [Methylophilaceae bacterium]|jgi:secondary thiamine-phosphate synthase enzyme|nr:secondary thiamine-phosphate synthase enzyme YjbQ [Methylophilaceae bacterium]